jgi:sugar-specific transcriptional regulator TrmB
MPKTGDDIIASLERLGLSSYESKAYLAAIGQPPITCYKLAQLSGVPRARIYEVVDKLAAKGLLLLQSGDKALLTAANYEGFLAQKESEIRENLDRLRKALAAIPSAESSGTWNVNGRSQVLQTARELMVAAERYVYVQALAHDVQALLPTMQRIRQRKIEIHGIYCGDLPQGLPGLVKHLGESGLVCSEIAVVVDGEQALIGCTQPEESASAAMTQNRGIIHITREYIRHEVFLNTLVGGKEPAAEGLYVRKYRSFMRRLP